MHINEMYPSDYLKADDVRQPMLLTVNGIDMAEFQDGTRKPVLKFANRDQGLVLNKTNALAVAAFLGEDTNNWIGQQVVLFVQKVPFQGKLVDSIRVRQPRGQQPAGKQQPQPEELPPGAEPDSADDVPF